MTPLTPTPEALRHRASARRWALTLLVAFTAGSVAGNVVVVLRRGLAPEDVVLAASAPVVLAGIAHLLAKFVQSGLPASGIGRGFYGAGIGAVSLIGAGAFILSFENLAALAARQHNWLVSGVFPLTLDLAIVVCTGIHVVIGRANENDQNSGVAPHRSWLAGRLGWGTAPATTTPAVATTEAVVETTTQLEPVDVVADEAAAIADDPVVGTPVVGPTTATAPAATTAATTTTADPVVEAPVEATTTPATSDFDVVAATTTTETVTPVVEELVATTTATPVVEEPVEAATTTEPVDEATTPVVEEPMATTANRQPLRLVAATTTITHAERAAELVETGRFKPEKQTAITQALALLDAEPRPSQREIAATVGVDRSVVRRLVELTA
ncbi:DUF2637 domain-containing protein [Mycobacteroides abscessus subsp. abscessus]|uniref:DUF2637 domain-containing protein n=1 Tax=Mycobacteroides abscessus TaxID=36809 RepID=UPI0039EEAC93